MAAVKSKNPKILIIDDEAVILHALGLCLQDEGWGTKTIAKFDHYLACIESSDLPDVIILDILFNHKYCLKIAKELKSNSKTSHIPIILISSPPNTKKVWRDLTIEAFLTQPCDSGDLKATIEKLLGVSKTKLQMSAATS